MKLFRRVHKRTIESAKKGVAKGIPFISKMWTKAISGITKATYYLILAGSNVGKTRIVLSLFWLEALEYTFKTEGKKSEDRVKGDVHVMLYSLEMPLDRILAIVAARWASIHTDIDLTTLNLSDRDIMGIEGKPSTELIEVMESEAFLDYLDTLEEYTNFYMNNSATGILNTIDKFCKSRSEKIDEDAEGQPMYRFKNPKFILIIVIDHISNIGTSSGDIDRNAIKKLSNGLVALRNMYGITPVVIQQANPTIERTLIPGHLDARDAKDTFIDADTVLGIGNPYKLGIAEIAYKGGVYFIIPNASNQQRGLMNTIRFFGTEKVRYNDLTAQAPFLFKGATAEIGDMPHPKDVIYEPLNL